MKVIYVAGPYRANNAWKREQNIRRAEELGFMLQSAGFAVVVPHAINRFMQDAIPDSHALAAALELMRRCDAVALAPGWERSDGTRAEVEEARKLNMPVFVPRDGERWYALNEVVLEAERWSLGGRS